MGMEYIATTNGDDEKKDPPPAPMPAPEPEPDPEPAPTGPNWWKRYND